MLALALSTSLSAQTLRKELTDTFYYADDWTRINERFATYYRLPVIKEGDRFRLIYFWANNVIHSDECVKAVRVDYHYSVEPGVGVNDGPFKTYFRNGTISTEGEYDNGLPAGEWKKYYPDGTIRRTEKFYTNQPFAYVTNYYGTGNKSSYGKFIRIRRGNDTVYRKEGIWLYSNDKEGSTSYIASYKLGMLHGPITYYDSATGQKSLLAIFKHDKRDSIWQYYNQNNGKVIRVDRYKNGLLNGRFYSKYEETGNLEIEGQYENGIREGKWVSYYDYPGAIQSIVEYENSEGHVIIYDSANNSRKKYEGDAYQNKRVGEWVTYDEALNIVKREVYANGYLEGASIRYDKKGTIVSNIPFREGLKNGKASYYFPNSDELFMSARYVDDKLESFKTYYPGKKIKRKTIVNKDGVKTTVCYDISGNKKECTEWFFDAKFDGDVMIYIGNNLRYPLEAKRLGIQGKVTVAFTIDENGLVKDPYIQEGFDDECDAEALRLIKQMPPWSPLKIDGVPMETNKTLPIVFWLPDEAIQD